MESPSSLPHGQSTALSLVVDILRCLRNDRILKDDVYSGAQAQKTLQLTGEIRTHACSGNRKSVSPGAFSISGYLRTFRGYPKQSPELNMIWCSKGSLQLFLGVLRSSQFSQHKATCGFVYFGLRAVLMRKVDCFHCKSSSSTPCIQLFKLPGSSPVLRSCKRIILSPILPVQCP